MEVLLMKEAGCVFALLEEDIDCQTIILSCLAVTEVEKHACHSALSDTIIPRTEGENRISALILTCDCVVLLGGLGFHTTVLLALVAVVGRLCSRDRGWHHSGNH